MSCIYRDEIYRVENCKNHFKIVGKIILQKKRMTWQLMWHNVRAAALNATLHFLLIYRYRCEEKKEDKEAAIRSQNKS